MRKGKKGFVIEMVILFMLITFGFCLVVTTYLATLNVERKYAQKQLEMNVDLNQVGEYYMRAIQAGQVFPTGQEDTFDVAEFDWMDDTEKAFFVKCKEKYDYTYESSFSIKRGNFLEFYAEKAVSRKLIVRTPGGVQAMVIIVCESRNANNNASYEVLDWSVTDIHEGIEYEEENISLLKKLWIWLGQGLKEIEDLFR